MLIVKSWNENTDLRMIYLRNQVVIDLNKLRLETRSLFVILNVNSVAKVRNKFASWMRKLEL